MQENSIERVKDDLHRLHEKAELTRKKTRSSEDRDFVMLIKTVALSLWGESPKNASNGKQEG